MSASRIYLPSKPPDSVVSSEEPRVRTLLEYHDRVFQSLRLRMPYTATYRNYVININAFSRFLGRTATLLDLTDDLVSACMGHLLEIGRKPSTVNKFRDYILALWRFAARKRHIESFPNVDRVKAFKRPPTASRSEQSQSTFSVSTGSQCDGNQTLITFFDNVFWPLKLGGRLGTIKLYRIHFRHFARHLGRVPTLADLNDETVGRFLAVHSKGRSPETVAGTRDKLLALWRFAARKGYVALWPDVPQIKKLKRVPRAWTLEQYQALLTSCAQQPGLVGKILARDWWVALHLVLFDTSLRIGAALAIQRPDVDLPEARILVRAETQKHRADELKRLHPQTVAAIRAIWEPERELLFPWNMANEMLYNVYGAILRRAGLPWGRRDKFHRIRRTSYTQVYKFLGPAAATQHAGHAHDLSRAYLDPTQLDGPVPVDVMPRPTRDERTGDAKQDTEPLARVLSEFGEAVRSGVKDQKHAAAVIRQVTNLVEGCGFRTIADIEVSAIRRWLEGLRASGRKPLTIEQQYRQPARRLLDWILANRSLSRPVIEQLLAAREALWEVKAGAECPSSQVNRKGPRPRKSTQGRQPPK